MFSLIKAIQNLLSELKKKKGLWFTILTVLSIAGISLSMYLLTTMTTSIAKDVYVNMSVTYKNNLEDKIEDKQKEFRKIILGLQTNDIFKNSLNDKSIIDPILELYNKNLVEMGFDGISLVFYSTVNQTNQYRNSINTVINRKIPSFGMEILPEGPSMVYLHPVLSGDNVLGVIEIKENLLSLKKDFERSKQSIFLFLIHKRSEQYCNRLHYACYQ